MERRARIVAAALQAFARYGYRRTTMADIAAAVGMSRPALYLVFPGKAAVFRALAEMLLADAMTGAEAAWPETMPAGEGLAAAILAKDLPIHQLLAATPHASEILAEAETIAGDLHRATAARFAALVTARLAAAGDPEPEHSARLVANAADGLKHARLDEATYVADVRRLAALLARR
ncbi:MAG: helix-turn-helix domain-containing protein [Polymorphobacter sp.]